MMKLTEAGMTLAETLVAIALTGIVAGVVVTQLVSPRASGESTALIQNLSGLGHAVQAYRGNVGRYPAALTDLTEMPEAGVSDLCGRSVPPHLLAEWRGPYLTREVQEAGIAVGEATMLNDLRREPESPGTAAYGVLYVDVTDVRLELAESVEAAFDGNAQLEDGSVRWTASADDDEIGKLSYGIPLRGC